MVQLSSTVIATYGSILMIMVGIVGWLLQRMVSKYDLRQCELEKGLVKLNTKLDQVLNGLYIVTEALFVICDQSDSTECERVRELAKKLREEVLRV